jgi:hypothetical protein
MALGFFAICRIHLAVPSEKEYNILIHIEITQKGENHGKERQGC